MVTPPREQLQGYHYAGGLHWRKSIVAIITQDRVINGNQKKQIKNRTRYPCRLFLLTRILQYISNWSKVFEHLPTLFLQYTQTNNFSKFCEIINFPGDYVGLYINWANTFFIYHPRYTSNFETTYKKQSLSRQLFFLKQFQY